MKRGCKTHITEYIISDSCPVKENVVSKSTVSVCNMHSELQKWSACTPKLTVLIFSLMLNCTCTFI